MMTPKEKAEELVKKFTIKVNVLYKEDSVPCIMNASITFFSAKVLAEIAIDEIINHVGQVEPFLGYDYWSDVKQELEKL